MMTLALGQLDVGDTLSRVILTHARHGCPHQPANGLEPTAFCRWFINWGEHFQYVLTPQKRHALITVLGTEPFNNWPARFLCFIGERLPFTRPIVRHNQRVDGPGTCPVGSDFA